MRPRHIYLHHDFACVSFGLAAVVAMAAAGTAGAAGVSQVGGATGSRSAITSAFTVATSSSLRHGRARLVHRKVQETVSMRQAADATVTTTTRAVHTEPGGMETVDIFATSWTLDADAPPGRRRRRSLPREPGSWVDVVQIGNGIGLRMGWHPAVEPELPEDNHTYHDKWRRIREEELWKDQFLTPGRVNEIMDPSNIQRLQFNVNPDSSFGAIFQLDTLVDVIPELIYPAWKEVARALNQREPSMHMVQRGYGWTPEQMFLREFNWRLTQEELEGGIEVYDRAILQKALKYEPMETRGSRRLLETLRTVPMPTAVLSRLPGSVVKKVMDRTGLGEFFMHRVTGDDEKFDDYRGYMLAAIKMQRSTMKCCAFDCRQVGMIKAHDAEMRGICQIGVMAAWELKLADYSVESFDDVTILDFRQVFADREFEPGATQVELQPEVAPKRKTSVATKISTPSGWADEEDEPETQADRGGSGGGGAGGGRRRPGRRL